MTRQYGALFWLSWLTPWRVYSVLMWATCIVSYVMWILMAYLMEVWQERLKDAAAIVNVLDGLADTMSIGITFLTEGYFGGYSMALITAATYCTGLGLLTMSAPPTLSKVLGTCREQKAACITSLQHSLFYVAAVAIAIGRSGYENSLATFWAEQLKAPRNRDLSSPNHCTDYDWIYLSIGIILIGTALIASIKSWAVLFGVIAVIMVIATLIFLCGTPSYKHVKPQGSPLTRVMRVSVAATMKIHLQCPSNTSQLHNPEAVELPLPHTDRLRFLDKASIIIPQGTNAEKSNWRHCTVMEVEETKHLLGMFPMWTTLLICGLVLSVGNTYFLEQCNNMETTLGKMGIPLVWLLFLSEFSRFITTKLYGQILNNCTESDQRCSPKLRIGLGMIFSILCCIVAALVENKRLNVIKNHGLLDEPGETVPMSVIWLTPQFLLLGTTDGLLKDGIKQFFYDNGPDSMKTYADQFAKSAIGVGTILSVVVADVSNRASKIGRKNGWFAATLNRSRLDYFYWTLACLSFVNLSYYFFISEGYTIMRGTEERPYRSNMVVPVQHTVVSVHPMVVPVHPDNMPIKL